MAYSDEQIRQVRELIQKGADSATIERQTGVAARTQRTWRRKHGWAVDGDVVRQIEYRIQELMLLDSPTPEQNELLGTLIDKLGRFNEQKEKTEDRRIKSTAVPGIRKKKNDFSGIDIDGIERPPFFEYQQEFLDDKARDRFYLKSRQIGFSWVVAWEALEDAMMSGKNKIFISASKNQVGQIRTYVKQFSVKYYRVQLSGTDKITIINPQGDLVEFHFLSTNSTTTQSYHGDLYIDEFCWIPNLRDLLDTALAQASHKHYRITYFSTPSVKSHYSYNIWEGLDEFGRKVDDEISRRVITIHDAEKKGCNLFDMDRLKKRFTPRQFAFLFLCEWIDDEGSIFKMADLEACYHKTKVKTDGGKLALENASLPDYKNTGNPVYIGYDPNGGGKNGDSASIAAGEHRLDRLRIIGSHTFNNKSINWQAATIKSWVKKYKAGFLGIDVTGIGEAVYNLVRDLPHEVDWPLTIKRFTYDRENKINLILHIERIVAGRKLEFDSEDKMILQSFLAIKAGTTGAGRSTIMADRKKGIGHADLFFAIAHLAYNFPIEHSRLRSSVPVGVSHGSGSGRGTPHSSDKPKPSTSIGVSNGSRKAS
ncbi:terminase family protein [bacterium]|nr:terminase family protein [bacterium]